MCITSVRTSPQKVGGGLSAVQWWSSSHALSEFYVYSLAPKKRKEKKREYRKQAEPHIVYALYHNGTELTIRQRT